MNQESPPPNMDDGHTMSSDTSGPVCLFVSADRLVTKIAIVFLLDGYTNS